MSFITKTKKELSYYYKKEKHFNSFLSSLPVPMCNVSQPSFPSLIPKYLYWSVISANYIKFTLHVITEGNKQLSVVSGNWAPQEPALRTTTQKSILLKLPPCFKQRFIVICCINHKIQALLRQSFLSFKPLCISFLTLAVLFIFLFSRCGTHTWMIFPAPPQITFPNYYKCLFIIINEWSSNLHTLHYLRTFTQEQKSASAHWLWGTCFSAVLKRPIYLIWKHRLAFCHSSATVHGSK